MLFSALLLKPPQREAMRNTPKVFGEDAMSANVTSIFNEWVNVFKDGG